MAYKQNLDLMDLKKLARRLASNARKKGLIIGLSGPLGSGKTTFAKAFALSLKINNLKSPTFIISQRYPFLERYLYHLDLYRLTNELQLTDLGLEEIFNHENVVLIEWIDKFPKLMKKCDLIISFKVKPNNKRDVQINSK
jgi:tRNA threonylcarbamoyladenosine biosynthesis protein TsaE